MLVSPNIKELLVGPQGATSTGAQAPQLARAGNLIPVRYQANSPQTESVGFVQTSSE
jgi:hypothetical protein